jgi:hypothetical protein
MSVYELDHQMTLLAHAHQAIDRYLGRGLMLLERRDGLMRLGFARVADYAGQFLGMAGRTALELQQIARELQRFPLIQTAYERGLLCKSKVREMLRCLQPEDEAAWVERARRLTVRGLRAELKAFKAARKQEDANALAAQVLPWRLGDAPAVQTCAPGSTKPAIQTCAPGSSEPAFQTCAPGSAEPAVQTCAQGSTEPAVQTCAPIANCENRPHLEDTPDIPGRMIHTMLSWDVFVRTKVALEMHRRYMSADVPFHAFFEVATLMYLRDAAFDDCQDEIREAARALAARELRSRAAAVAAAEARQQALEERTQQWAHLEPVVCSTVIPLLPTLDHHSSPRQIHQALLQAVRLRQRSSWRLMQLLRSFKDRRGWEKLRFYSFAHYARERLQRSTSLLMLLLQLHAKLLRLPHLRDEFEHGQLHLVQVELLTRVANAENEQRLIELAQRLVVDDLRTFVDRALEQRSTQNMILALEDWIERNKLGKPRRKTEQPDITAASEAIQTCAREQNAAAQSNDKTIQTCARENAVAHPAPETPPLQTCAPFDGPPLPPHPPLRDVLLAQIDPDRYEHLLGEDKLPGTSMPQVPFSFYLPAELEEFWLILEAVIGETWDGPGSCPPIHIRLQAIVDYYLEEHAQEALESIRKHRIAERDHWRCAVPGCTSRRNLHEHHIIFRSAGGTDVATNKITLCEVHHQHGIHAGRIRLRGTAPDGLRWELGVEPDQPPVLTVEQGYIVDREAEYDTYEVEYELEYQAKYDAGGDIVLLVP